MNALGTVAAAGEKLFLPENVQKEIGAVKAEAALAIPAVQAGIDAFTQFETNEKVVAFFAQNPDLEAIYNEGAKLTAMANQIVTPVQKVLNDLG